MAASIPTKIFSMIDIILLIKSLIESFFVDTSNAWISWSAFTAILVVVIVLIIRDTRKFSVSTEVEDYIDNVCNLRLDNGADTTGAKLTVTLNKSKEAVEHNAILINQEIEWELHITVSNSQQMNYFEYYVSMGMYTAIFPREISNIDISAKLIARGTELTPEIKGERLGDHISKLRFDFGETYNVGENITLIIRMKWKTGRELQYIDEYFADPRNYGKSVNNVTMCIKSDTDIINRREVELREIDKDTKKQQIKKKINFINGVVLQKITPQDGKMYSLYINKKRKLIGK